MWGGGGGKLMNNEWGFNDDLENSLLFRYHDMKV